MVFADDTDWSLRAAVELVNTAEEPETLATSADLDDFYRRYRYSGSHPRDHAELDAVRAARPALRELLTAERDAAVEIVNRILAEHRALPQLLRHDDWDWHVHAVDAEAPLAERILVETAMAMIDVIRADDLSRLSVCADDTCEALVLDLSRNRSKIYCSTTCGNRNAVAAYRARQADDPEVSRRAERPSSTTG